jgi:hypothetical protein
MEGVIDLLRAYEMDMAVDSARGDDPVLAGDDLGARTDDDVDSRLDIRVSGLADGMDEPVAQADIGLLDAG